jgi:hypothetical protein
MSRLFLFRTKLRVHTPGQVGAQAQPLGASKHSLGFYRRCATLRACAADTLGEQGGGGAYEGRISVV